MDTDLNWLNRKDVSLMIRSYSEFDYLSGEEIVRTQLFANRSDGEFIVLSSCIFDHTERVVIKPAWETGWDLGEVW